MRSRFDPLAAAAMTVTIVAISATAPLTAYASASPLAMAFWRNCLGFAVLGPFLLLLRRREVARVARGERGVLRREQWRPLVFGFLAATSLTLHFASFMTSTRLTSVAMSTALVATQPVWQALIASVQGVRTARRARVGLTLAVVGAAAAAGLDIRSGGTALVGDLLALLGAISQAGYTALSEKSRADVSTPLYSAFTSLVCGVQLLGVCWLAGIPLTGFDRSTQLSLLGLLILPQILGLGSLNFVLGRTSATTTSVLLLLETPVAALAAWWLMDQGIKPGTIPGLALIIIGVTVAVTSGSGERQYDPRVVIPPYPAYAPSIPLPHFPSDTLTLRRSPARDPRVIWSRYSESETPTITLTYHGAGAFDTLTLRRPRPARNEEPGRP
ncbi:DMT family transporter [Streptomyces sp. NPDC002588]|uniref:DMT family transporter n=1 Tax=Streptomyces sp. NPDC002588 TaxID=3154419 RepID=UPI00332FEB52